MARAAALLLPAALLLCLGSAGAATKMVGVYELKNKKGDFSIKVTNWGATLMSVIAPDSKGRSPSLLASNNPAFANAQCRRFVQMLV
jgi:aldose 1-epimerase